jgi:hypothetical protein
MSLKMARYLCLIITMFAIKSELLLLRMLTRMTVKEIMWMKKKRELKFIEYQINGVELFPPSINTFEKKQQ